MIVEPFDDPATVQRATGTRRRPIIPFDDPSGAARTGDVAQVAVAVAAGGLARSDQGHVDADGTVRRIFEKYFPPELARAMTQF